VHTYLIYGFSIETEQETLENLERVRQLFALGYIRSSAWSPFSLTVYSPLALNPDRYGIRPRIPDPGTGGKRTFTHHFVPYEDPAYDQEMLGAGLRRAGYHLWEPRRPISGEQFHGESPVHRQRRELRRGEYRRLRTLFGMREGRVGAPYGLGAVRMLADYERFIGIDMRRRALTSLTGLLGVAENSRSDEVLSKFGSLKEPFRRRFLPP